MAETYTVQIPDGTEVEIPVDTPKEEVRRIIGGYIKKTMAPEQIDAIPTKTRLAFGLGQGEVAAKARKNLANIEAEKTANEYGEDVRGVWAQGVREIGTPIAAGAVGLATGGLGAIPILAAAGTAAAGETIAQMGAPSESVGKDIAVATAIGGMSELGGQLLAASVGKLAAKSGISKAAEGADFENLAKRLGFPMKNVEGRVGSGLQARVDAARRAAITKEADEIMKPYGSPLTAEIAGAEAGGVFKNIEEHFVGHARDLRKFMSMVVGDTQAPLRTTLFRANELKKELGKRAFKGKEELDPFFNAMFDEDGALKRFTMDELLALRTDVGREMGRLGESNPKKAVLKRLYGAMSEDAEAILEMRDPRLAKIFKQSNEDFGTYFGALKNEVASRLMTEANAGNGTAVVKELFKADPSDINHVFQFVQKTRPQDMGRFRKTLQQAALQNIFGVADDGAPVMGNKLAERLEKLGADRLETIFGGSKEAQEALGRVRELAKLTGRFERSLKIPPDMSRQMDSGVKNLVMQAGVALAAKAWGAPYAAARVGAGVLKGAGDLILAELAVRPELYRRFTQGWQKMATAVSSTSMTTSARNALTRAGESDIKAALGTVSNMVAIKMSADAKRAKVEQDKEARRQGGQPQGFMPQVGVNPM